MNRLIISFVTVEVKKVGCEDKEIGVVMELDNTGNEKLLCKLPRIRFPSYPMDVFGVTICERTMESNDDLDAKKSFRVEIQNLSGEILFCMFDDLEEFVGLNVREIPVEAFMEGLIRGFKDLSEPGEGKNERKIEHVSTVDLSLRDLCEGGSNRGCVGELVYTFPCFDVYSVVHRLSLQRK